MPAPQPATPLREKIGLGVIVVTGIILAETYWQYRDAWGIFRELPPMGLALFAAAGGAVGGWLFAKTAASRLAAMLSGALCNFGGVVAFQFFFESSTRLTTPQRLLGFGAGALPGIILAVGWLYYLEKKSKAGPTP